MSQWPLRDEIEKIKALRQHFHVLNNSVSSIPDGKKTYVVLNGQVMVRSSGGKLQNKLTA